MINVGILGAANPDAGELIRLLVNHPEVDLKLISDESKIGQNVASVHHGLVGETNMIFSNAEDLESLDVLFLCFNTISTRQFLANYNIPENQYIIDFSGAHMFDDNSGFVYGLSELNRKPLVRGAYLATIPSTAAVGILISLLPLVLRTDFGCDINIEISGDSDCNFEVSKEVMSQLRKIGFKQIVNITSSRKEHRRGVRIKTRIVNKIQIDELISLYESYYDDHNMTFVINQPLDFKEVEGSDKCLISLYKENELIVIDTILDGKLRGGAGDAVHIMNLFCGFHEKVGLSLKAVNY